MSNSTLIALLSTPIRRGMRCDGCVHWQPDPPDYEHGECAEHSSLEGSTSAHWACVYWSPMPGCGLDYMGIPLASSLADQESLCLL